MQPYTKSKSKKNKNSSTNPSNGKSIPIPSLLDKDNHHLLIPNNNNNRYKGENTDVITNESQDKGSLNAIRSFLNYGVFAEERLMDDTYRHARPYNLVLMSTKSLWIVYLLFYGIIIGSTIYSITEDDLTNDYRTIPNPSYLLLCIFITPHAIYHPHYCAFQYYQTPFSSIILLYLSSLSLLFRYYHLLLVWCMTYHYHHHLLLFESVMHDNDAVWTFGCDNDEIFNAEPR